jgi:hypothetical protein
MNKIDICNMALGELGSNSIVSLTENTPSAQACNTYYTISLESVLRDYDWGFARKQVELSLSVESTHDKWLYSYVMPPDCLAARRIYNSSNDSVIDFEMFSDGYKTLICTDQADAELVYTARTDLVNLFDPIFIEALSFKLASKMCQMLKADQQLKSSLHQQYMIFLARAQGSDAKEGTIMRDTSSSFVDARL